MESRWKRSVQNRCLSFQRCMGLRTGFKNPTMPYKNRLWKFGRNCCSSTFQLYFYHLRPNKMVQVKLQYGNLSYPWNRLMQEFPQTSETHQIDTPWGTCPVFAQMQFFMSKTSWNKFFFDNLWSLLNFDHIAFFTKHPSSMDYINIGICLWHWWDGSWWMTILLCYV